MPTYTNVWDLVEKYYPNYSSCCLICEASMLDSILANEIPLAENGKSDTLEYFNNECEGSKEIVQNRWNELHATIYEKTLLAINESKNLL